MTPAGQTGEGRGGERRHIVQVDLTGSAAPQGVGGSRPPAGAGVGVSSAPKGTPVGVCAACGRVSEGPPPESAASPEECAALFVPRLRALEVEELHAAYLNRKGRVLAVEMVSRGGLAGNLVEPRALFRPAIAHNAAAVVIAHNHPSGDPEPSRDDLLLTHDLARAGEIMGVRLLDHIIVGGERWASLAKAGEL